MHRPLGVVCLISLSLLPSLVCPFFSPSQCIFNVSLLSTENLRVILASALLRTPHICESQIILSLTLKCVFHVSPASHHIQDENESVSHSSVSNSL